MNHFTAYLVYQQLLKLSKINYLLNYDSFSISYMRRTRKHLIILCNGVSGQECLFMPAQVSKKNPDPSRDIVYDGEIFENLTLLKHVLLLRCF